MLKIDLKATNHGIGLVSFAFLLSNIFLMARLGVVAVNKISDSNDLSQGSDAVNNITSTIKKNSATGIVPNITDTLFSTVPTYPYDISASLQFIGLMDNMLNEKEIAPLFIGNEICPACNAALGAKPEKCQHLKRPDMENLVHINRLLLIAAKNGKNGVALDSKPLLESIQTFYQNITGFDIDGLDMSIVQSINRNSAGLYILLGIALFASLSTSVISIITFRWLQRRKLNSLTSNINNEAEA